MEQRPAGGIEEDHRTQRRALARSLHAALDALEVCVERMHEVISVADEVMGSGSTIDREPSVAAPRRCAHISYGGGPSPLAAEGIRPSSSTAASGSPAPPRDPEVSATDLEARLGPASPLAELASERGEGDVRTAALMAATEMVYRGLGREEISERMRRRWGGAAAQILREVIE